MKIVNTLIAIVALVVLGLVGYSLVMNKTTPEVTQNPNPNATSTVATSSQPVMNQFVSTKYGLELSYPSTYREAQPQSNEASTSVLILETKTADGIGTPTHRLVVSRISTKVLSEDSTEFKNLLIKSTIFDASGLNPESFAAFTKRTMGKNVYYYIPSGRFEGVLSFDYYLATPKGVFKFVSTSYGVDWTNPSLDGEADAGHILARGILSTVSVVTQ